MQALSLCVACFHIVKAMRATLCFAHFAMRAKQVEQAKGKVSKIGKDQGGDFT